MPLNIDLTQVLLHMLNLVILVGGLALILYKPVAKFLRDRRTHFQELERTTAEAEREAREMKAEYEEKFREADRVLKENRAAAEREIAESTARYMEEAKNKADAILRSAEAEAEARKAHVLEAAQTEIGEMVLSAAQKLLSDTASPEGDAALYDAFIRQAEREIPDKGDKHED
ncbi:MAG: ATP synthase F0 subunit B [Clostridia bacterium]|nr:ATP synthase F0 subunit B [Clostridia bacterium]